VDDLKTAVKAEKQKLASFNADAPDVDGPDEEKCIEEVEHGAQTLGSLPKLNSVHKSAKPIGRPVPMMVESTYLFNYS